MEPFRVWSQKAANMSLFWLRWIGESVLVVLLWAAKAVRPVFVLSFLLFQKQLARGILLSHKKAKEAKARFEDMLARKGWIRTLVPYLSPIAGLLFLFVTVQKGLSAEYAVAVSTGDGTVAYVSDESVYANARESLSQKSVDGAFSSSSSLRLVKADAGSLLSTEELAEMILSHTQEAVEGEGLFIDGEYYCASREPGVIQTALDTVLSRYSDEGSASFAEEVLVKEGIYPSETVLSKEELNALLESSVSSSAVSLSYAARSLSSEEVLRELEAEAEISVPVLTVKVIRRETVTESIPFSTEIQYDDTKYQGYEDILVAGKDGKQLSEYNVEYINGEEVGRTLLSSAVLSEAVTEEKIQGTRSVEEGTLIWPLGGVGGYISCYYGENGHNGVDIAAPLGTDIYAAASGTVVVANWYYSYGNCVMIEHPDGTRTLYGHCSALYVSVGDSVTVGQVIAAVGSTGYSSGNHLHFEYYQNGSRKDPLDFLDGWEYYKVKRY